MLEHKDMIISASTANRLFLEIEKNYSGRYIVKIAYNVSLESMIRVFELLQQYGDIFAAYVNNINPNLALSEREDLVKNFPVIMENMEVIVAKTDNSHPDHNCASANVNNIGEISKYIEYQGHLYIFTEKSE